MANPSNLIPNSERSPNELRENGRKGGIKSGKVRAEKKSNKEQLKILLDMPVSDSYGIRNLQEAGFDNSEMNNQLYLTYSLFEKAIGGDVKAISLIFKTIKNEDGEKANSFNDTINDLFTI